MNNIICQFQLIIAQKINKLIYTILNFRPLRGLISEEWYVRSDIKKALGILCMIWNALKDIIWKAFYFILVIIVPNGLLAGGLGFEDNKTLGNMFAWTFLICSCFMGTFTNSRIVTDGSEEDYLLLNLMRIDAKQYYLTRSLCQTASQTVYWTVAFLLIVGRICPGHTGVFLWVLLCYICCRPIGEAVSLKLCEHYDKIPYQDKNPKVQGGYYMYNFAMVLLAYLCYPVLYLLQSRLDDKHIQVFHPLFDAGRFSLGLQAVLLLILLVAAVVSVRYMRAYPKYLQVARICCGFARVTEKQKQAEGAGSIETKLENSLDEDEVPERLFPNKNGYDYLHAIFFERHKKLLRRPSQIKRWLAEGIFAVAALAVIVSRFVLSGAQFQSMSDSAWKVVNLLLPVLVFVMYCSSSGEKLTQAMFFHCDASLLKYGYYRTPEAIISSFRIRLEYMLQTEAAFILTFCVGVFVNLMLLGRFRDMLQIVAILGCIVILSVFFSVLFLCMYYIFQPFTEAGNTTSVGYKACSVGVYVAAYSCLQLHTPPTYFAVLLLSVTVVTMVVGILLVWKLAPKTFRLR